ncbi:unnamed protein product [Effrenium voratum]|uniref:Uncharacterized protein n=1 Tax=Effrenium voratum TaxID=2562239 RepID=A0AA36N7Z2_9DINO|nr:unnamed protein product [Effrenium voratum]CAJ1393786.1 unnamed protein product [Effrenium voratum]CAJ1461682.1 unnamed protein product [Effrenium voratum]
MAQKLQRHVTLRQGLLSAMIVVVACRLCRRHLDAEAFANVGVAQSRELVARWAYKPILRRDPTQNQKLQVYAGQQLRLVKRQEAGGFSNPTERKQLYLKKLGLDKKAEELDQRKNKPAWHLNHIAAGDVFLGHFQHPGLSGNEQLDLKLEASSENEAILLSKRGDLDDTVSFQQDYPIAFEPGEQKDSDMTAYTFHKFNQQWRDFETSMPSEEDCQHLTLPMLQLFFSQVAEVEDFPSKDEFAENCADPAKGMTREEFLKYLRAESPDYLEKSFPGIYTGRRLRFTDGKLVFDGDFQSLGDNLIYGFVTLDGKPGGTFSLELTKKR